MEWADQVRVIGGRIERPQRAPKAAILAVFEDDGVPALPVVRRLDQGKGEIAQRALVVGQVIDRDRTASLRCGLLSDPGMNIVVDQRLLQPAEIADAGAAAKDQESEDGKRRCRAERTDSRRHRCNNFQRRLMRRRPPLAAGGGICGSALSATGSA